MKIQTRTVIASSATYFVALCVMLCATWGFHWIDFPLIALFGRRTAGMIVYALVICLPILAVVALKAALKNRLAGWRYVLIPPAVVLLIVGIAVALFTFFIILPNVA